MNRRPCMHLTKRLEPCKGKAIPGSKYCSRHSIARDNLKFCITVLLALVSIAISILDPLGVFDGSEGNTPKDVGVLISPSEEIYPPVVKIGNSESYLILKNEAGMAILPFFRDMGLNVWVENEKLLVSAKIFDANGNIVAEIVENEWKVSGQEDRSWDRNYTDNALEIKDNVGDIIFQILIEEKHIQLAVKIYNKDGEGFELASSVLTEEDIIAHEEGESLWIESADPGEDWEWEAGTISGGFRRTPSGAPMLVHIEPIFLYPSDLHLGELSDQ